MGATPPEEIARQHAAACAVLRESRAASSSSSPSPRLRGPSHCAPPRVDRGEVPLRWKRRPTATAGAAPSSGSSFEGVGRAPAVAVVGGANPNSPDEGVEVLPAEKDGEFDDSPEWCVSSRGQVDVTPIVALIKEGVNDPAALAAPSTSSSSPAKTIKSKKNGAKKGKSKKTLLHSHKNKTHDRTEARPFSPANLWDEENAARNNVKITRPSHDAWGIKKIVLVFCDDFLHTIYTLPWYQRDNVTGSRMHAAIQPILDVLQIQQSQLVRCLLAGLPPGVTIPVHHDTGEWVRHTHRVHVPVVVPDPSRVLFRCGLTERTMERVDCAPGHVFEMNNQAKHAVTNAMLEEYRVHLILDYVAPEFFATRKSQNCPVRRVDLAPGEVITQTRRSIDRALDAGSRRCPSYLILGAQKAGTTSLYEYLNQHPWVVRAKRRETHCLDWRWDPSLRSAAERREHCLSFYHTEEMRPYPSLRTGDSTPSYLLDYFRVIPRVKECLDHDDLRFIIMTRDPIKRAVSHYKMVTSRDGTPEQMAARGSEWRSSTLEEVLERDVRDMKEDGLLPYWDPETKTVDADAFDAFADSREEDAAWERYVMTRVPLRTGSYAPLARGMYALQCRQWFRSFPAERFLVMRLEDMSSPEEGGRGAQWAVDRALEHLGLPRFAVPDAGARNAREYRDPLEGEAELRGWLQRFFAPHNRRFGRMLVEELGYDVGSWRDVWSYED